MTKKIFRLRSVVATVTLALTFAVTQLFAQTSPAGSPVATHGQLSVVDGRIVDKNLQPVQLRGMSLYWSMGPASARNYYNADVVKYIAENWNASLVRAAMGIEARWTSDQAGYLNGDNSGGVSNKKRVTDVVDAAIEAGIYVIIDWHSHEAEKHIDKAVEFFQEMATAYKSYPNIIYEIYNEPLNLNWKDVLRPYMQTVTDAIRAIDPNNIIIIGTPNWCQDVHVAASNPVDGNHLAYSAHFYAGDVDANGNPTPVHTTLLRSRIYETMTVKKQAVFISEFGSVNAQGKGTHNAAQTDIWMNFMDENKLSWANWSLSAISEPASALLSSASTSPGVGGAEWTDANLSEAGLYMRNKLRTPPNTNGNMFRYMNVTIVGDGNVTPRYRTATGVVGGEASFVLDKDTTIFLRASPAAQFIRWEDGDGNVIGTDPAYSPDFVMNKNYTVTAVFVTDPNVKHNVTLIGTGRGSVGAGEYSSGARVIISSGVPPAGKKFVRWETASSGVAFKNAKKGKTEFTMPPGSVTITAVFE